MLFPFPGVPQQPQECEELGNSYQTEREESEISELFAIGRHQMNRCLKCNKEVPFQGLHYAIIIMSSYSRKPHLAISAATISQCFLHQEERESVVLACALQYPPPSTIKDIAAEPKGGFVQLLLASLSSKRSTPAWCEHCKRFSPTLQRGKVVR